MSRPTLVLDANAFSSKELWHWLVAYPGRKVLPLVAFVEVGAFHASRGRLEGFRSYLAEAGIEVEWMRMAEAEHAIQRAISSGGFADNARDYLIAGHVHGDRVLVTSNLQDFSYLEEVVEPGEAIRRFSR